MTETWTVFADSIKIVGGAIAFSFAYYQYRRAERWKTVEFAALRMKEFEADEKIQAALTMLDWTDRPVPLRSNKTGETKPVVVSEAMLLRSLLSFSPPDGFTDVEASIRDCFDRFLDSLVRLQAFIETRAVRHEDLKPYILYWLQLTSGQGREQHTAEFYALLHVYINKYGFDPAWELMKSYGYGLRHSIQETEAAEKKALAMPREPTARQS